MIVDTSAIVAVGRREPAAERILEVLRGADEAKMSTATWVELGVVVDHADDPVLSGVVDDLLVTLGVQLEPVTEEQARVARRAYRDFGRGNHPARLNFGDCFSYALAKVMRQPLLFVGDDFVRTDVRSVL